MLIKTFERAVAFGALPCLLLLPQSCAGASGDKPEVQVAVYNDAKVDGSVVEQAESVGAEVFEDAGLKVKWRNCGRLEGRIEEAEECTRAVFPTHLQLRILSRPRAVPEFTFGLSYLGADGAGCYSEVFAVRVGEMSAKAGLSEPAILGHVMAHEIAHLLLGTNSHAASGIMKARWQVAELKDASRGELRFTLRQSEAMRRKVEVTRTRASAQSSGRAAAD